jgi:acid phosphatase type 7
VSRNAGSLARRTTTRLAALFLVALAVWACGNTGPSPASLPQSTVLAATATPGMSANEIASPKGSFQAGALPSAAAPSGSLDGSTGGSHLPQLGGSTGPVTVTIVAAGDIACDPAHNVGTPQDCDQAATAAEIGTLRPTAVLTLGDNQYQDGTLAGFETVFGPTWGRYRSIMYPAIGNHEYLTTGASGYFDYFGVPAYYSYNLGDWHMVALDSECSYVGGCAVGSAQESWLRADLAAHNTLCTLVYWHEPRWSSGEHGDATQMTAIWSDLVAARVDVVLTGHNHDYERFAPLNAAGQLDPNGVTEFVVGTGGKNHYGFVEPPLTGELVRNDTSFGVIRMALGPTGYSWRFYPAPGYTFTDAGSAACH